MEDLRRLRIGLLSKNKEMTIFAFCKKKRKERRKEEKGGGGDFPGEGVLHATNIKPENITFWFRGGQNRREGVIFHSEKPASA